VVFYACFIVFLLGILVGILCVSGYMSGLWVLLYFCRNNR
jgi:hypothetical protein